MSGSARRLGVVGERIEQELQRVGRRMDERKQGQGGQPRSAPAAVPAAAASAAGRDAVDLERDPMSSKVRAILYVVTAAVVSYGTAFFTLDGWGGQFPYAWFTSFMTILGAVAGLSMTARWLEPGLQREARFVRHLAYGGLACVWAALLDIGPYLVAWNGSRHAITTGRYLTGTALSIAIVLFLVNWSKIIDPARRERIALGPALSAAFVGFLVNLFFDGSTPFVIGTLAGIAMAVQACSPFDPLAIRRRKQSREVKVEGDFELGANAPNAHQRRRESCPGRRQDRQEQRRQGRVERFNRVVTALDLHGQPRACRRSPAWGS